MGVCECKNRNISERDEHKAYERKLAALQKALEQSDSEELKKSYVSTEPKKSYVSTIVARSRSISNEDEESFVEEYDSSDNEDYEIPSDQESENFNEEDLEEDLQPEMTNKTAFSTISQQSASSVQSESNSSVNGGAGVFSLADLKIADLTPEEVDSIQKIRQLQSMQQALLN